MIGERQHQKTVNIGGERLDIVARQIGGMEWELSVKNSLGVRSVWLEFFKTPDAAIDAAIEAIESEGPETFASVEGFEYLLES